MIKLNHFAANRSNKRQFLAPMKREMIKQAAKEEEAAELEAQAEHERLMALMAMPQYNPGKTYAGKQANLFVGPTGGLWGNAEQGNANRRSYSFVQPKTPSTQVGSYGTLDNTTMADPSRKDDAWAEQKQHKQQQQQQPAQQVQPINQPQVQTQQPINQPAPQQTQQPALLPTPQVQAPLATIEDWNNQMNGILSSEKNKEFTISVGKAPPPETTDGELEKLEGLGAHQYYYQPMNPDDIDENTLFTGCTIEELEEIYPELIRVGEDGNKRIDGARAGLVALSLLGEVSRKLGQLEAKGLLDG